MIIKWSTSLKQHSRINGLSKEPKVADSAPSVMVNHPNPGKRAVAIVITIGRFCKRYSLLSAADSLRSCRIHVIPNEWLTFYSAFKKIFIIIFFRQSSAEVVWFRRQRCLVVAWLVPRQWNCCCLGAGSVYAIQPCTTSFNATKVGSMCV